MSKGIRLMIWATVFYGLMNFCIKFLKDIPAHEIVFFRSLITLIITWFALRQAKINPWGNNKKLLIGRGLAGFVSLSLYIYTVQHVSLASAVTIQYLSPIFTTIFAVFFLSEKMKLFQWGFYVFSFAGVFLIKGFDNSVSNEMLAIGIVSALGSGIAYNIIRRLRDEDHPLVIVFYFPLVTLPLISVFTLMNFKMPTPLEWLMLIGAGVFTQFAQTYMTRAYQLEEISKVSILTYLGTIYALTMGTLFFDEVYTWQVLAGIALIVIGIVGNILYKRRLESKFKASQQTTL